MSQFLNHAKIHHPELNIESDNCSPSQNLELTIEFQDLFDYGLLPELQDLLGAQKGMEEYELLVDIYLSCLPKRVDEIRLAYEYEDWQTLHRLFHNFKASSSYVGGHYLAWLSENLGQMCLADLKQTERFISRFESFHIAVHRLKQHLEFILG